MPKALFFSVSIGAGHDLAARGVLEELQRRCPESELKIIDTFKYINPVLDKVVKGSYMETLRFNPRVWGYLYDQQEDTDKLIDIKSIMNKLLSPKLESLVAEFKPDVLVCSHAFPCGMLASLKKSRRLTTPILAVITDYTVHPFWVYDEVDWYVIPSEQLRFNLLAAGINADKILPLGLPIRAQFLEEITPAAARSELGLADRPTVLVMGGGLGLGSLEEIVQTLAKSSLDLQVVAICGKNKKLQAKLEAAQGWPNPPVVVGFTEQMALYMRAADVIVTKPGGLTTAEALVCRVPLLIVDPIPGQETRNTDFLLNHGVALKASSVREIVSTLQQYLACPLRQEQMRTMAAQLGKPNAAVDIVNILESRYFSGPCGLD